MLKSVKSQGCVSQSYPQLLPLRIDRQVLETVRSHKVLGLVIQEILKWHELISDCIQS